MSITSSLLSASNNIVRSNRSAPRMRKTKNEFASFLNFMDVQTSTLKSQKFNQRKLKKALNANVSSSFGRSGNLLSGLASGALDAASFVGEFFGQNRKVKPNVKAGKPIPKGPKVRFGGMRALNISNALFAGLDFATGLAEGESVGKAAAGAGGALAGSMLGGAIGQALIPVPGLGFFIGQAVGGAAGGWLGDRVYEGVTGEGSSEQKTTEKLRSEAKKQKEQSVRYSSVGFGEVVDKFESVVYKFERVVAQGFFGSISSSDLGSEQDSEPAQHQELQPRKGGGKGFDNPVDNNYTVTGGELPSKYVNTPDWNEFRQYYNEGKGGNHQGEDLPIAQGTPISLVVPGKVTQASFSGDGAGGNVLITHEDNKQTRYLHMSEIYVKPGESVESGKVIGLTGGEPGTKGAGRSTGPHLHFEFYNSTSGPPADPTSQMDKYFRFGGSVSVTPKAKPKVESQTKAAGVPTANQPTNLSEQIAALEKEKSTLQEESTAAENWMMNTKSGDKSQLSVSRVGTLVRGRNAFQQGEDKFYDPSGQFVQGGFDEYRATVAAKLNKLEADIAKLKSQQSGVSPVQASSTVPQGSDIAQSSRKIEQYPSYAVQGQTITFIPIQGKSQPAQVASNSYRESQQPQMSGGVSQSAVVNSLLKTILLTNLSGT